MAFYNDGYSTRRQRRDGRKSFLASTSPHEKKEALDEENNVDEYDEETRRRALHQHAYEATISGTFKGSLNHENLKHDPDKARESRKTRVGRGEDICC